MSTERLQMKFKKIAPICGGVLVVLFSNFPWLWGNLAVYVHSYSLLNKDAASDIPVETPWLIYVNSSTWTVGAILAGLFIANQWLSRRHTLVLGMVLFNAGLFLSYFVFQANLGLLILTIGVMNGFGDGLITTTTLLCVVDWTLNSQVGIVTSLLAGSTNIGSIITNQFVTHYINPENVSPDLKLGPTRYFTSKDILQRVPMVFIFYGSAATIVHIIAFCLLKTKPPENQISIDETNDEYPSKKDQDLMSLKNGQNDLESESSLLKTINGDRNHTGSSQMSHLRGLLKRKSFYSLWFSFLLLPPGLIVPLNYYKTFGQVWIKDDYFLTDLGSFVSIVVFFARLFWGYNIDRCGIKTTLLNLTMGIAIISSFYYFTPQVNQWLYLFSSLVYLSIGSGIVPSYKAAIIKLFGKEHFAIHNGLLLSAYFISNLSAPPILKWILSQYGWFQLFFSTGVVSFVALLIVILFLEQC